MISTKISPFSAVSTPKCFWVGTSTHLKAFAKFYTIHTSAPIPHPKLPVEGHLFFNFSELIIFIALVRFDAFFPENAFSDRNTNFTRKNRIFLAAVKCTSPIQIRKTKRTYWRWSWKTFWTSGYQACYSLNMFTCTFRSFKWGIPFLDKEVTVNERPQSRETRNLWMTMLLKC